MSARSLLCALCLSILFDPRAALAQLDAPPEPVLEQARTSSVDQYAVTVHSRKPSPAITQDRSFTTTRFWLLDPGSYETEVWYRTRIFSTKNGAPAEHLFQAEIEIGLLPHLQIDIYENLDFNVRDDGLRSLAREGTQLEARIAIPEHYGEMWGNPVIYLEWHPRHADPDRAELRLLLGGEVFDGLYLAFNPYLESNVVKTDRVDEVTGKKSSTFIADAEAGATLAAGYRIADWFRVSAELKAGGDMLGDSANAFHWVAFLGPGLILKPLPGKAQNYLKIMYTLLFALPGTADGAQQLQSQLILGCQF